MNGFTEQYSNGGDSIYQIRVDLAGIRPPIWRRLLISSDTTLDWVHEILQEAMGWMGYHLHLFTGPEGEYCPVEHGLEDTMDERMVTLEELLPTVGSRARYEYDFGDGWLHTLRLEKILAPEPDVLYPRCVKGRRAGPPEDVGGPPGYEIFLEAMADPTHPEHEDYAEWIGSEEYDPEAFDLEDVNFVLEEIAFEMEDAYAQMAMHPMTAFRNELLAPDFVQFMSAALMEEDQMRDEIARQERAIRRSRSVPKLMDILPTLLPSLFEFWANRLLDMDADIPQLITKNLTLTLPEDKEARDRQLWINQRLCVLVHRYAPEAATVLSQIWDDMADANRSLACVVWGQLDLGTRVDLIREHCRAMLGQHGYGAAMGALWALVDLEDPMAADVLAEAVASPSEGLMIFPELWPMLSQAGDARVIGSLLGISSSGPSSWGREALHVLQCIAHRLGKDAFRRAASAAAGFGVDASLPAEMVMFIEALYKVDEAQVQDYYRHFFEGMTMEELWAAMQDEAFEVPPDEDAMFWDPVLDDPEEGDLLWDNEEEIWEPDPSLRRQGASEKKPFTPPGRNDPCWCGSGKKYKHCHWHSDQQDPLGRVQTG